MLIPSPLRYKRAAATSLSRRVNANSQQELHAERGAPKLIKKGEC